MIEGTFTNTTQTVTPMVDLQELLETGNNLRDEFLKNFEGMPIRKDDNLNDFQFYVLVSPECLSEIEKLKQGTAGNRPFSGIEIRLDTDKTLGDQAHCCCVSQTLYIEIVKIRLHKVFHTPIF